MDKSDCCYGYMISVKENLEIVLKIDFKWCTIALKHAFKDFLLAAVNNKSFLIIISEFYDYMLAPYN